MTDLRRPVKRRTVDENYRGRRLIVSLIPGDVLEIREQGRRLRAQAPLGKVYMQLVKWNVDAIASAKRAERKAKRGLR